VLNSDAKDPKPILQPGEIKIENAPETQTDESVSLCIQVRNGIPSLLPERGLIHSLIVNLREFFIVFIY
jgi:hypothetical protein